jgi:tetratricopeptide (TPR) repeat protein
VATSCNNLGHALQELGQLQEAEAYLQRASEQYRQMGHRLGEATASCNLGGIAYRQKQWAKALELLDAGIASMEAQQLQGLLSEVYNHRIEIYLEQNELEIALKYLSLNSPEVHEHGDPIQQGRLERLWGHYYLKTQQLENAKEHLHKALDLLQPSGHRIECQLLYRDLADWHRSSGSHESAYWEEASQNLLAEEVAP